MQILPGVLFPTLTLSQKSVVLAVQFVLVTSRRLQVTLGLSGVGFADTSDSQV